MDKLYKPSVVKELLDRHGFKFSKALGQNFLIDQNIISTIIEGSKLGEGDLVIEIGPGAGTLTQELVERAKKVIAIELDDRLIPVLEESLADSVDLIHADALDIDYKSLIDDNPCYDKYRLVANLPYNVGTRIVAKILEERVGLDSMTIMLQKEVAARMMAAPGSKDYGAISILTSYYARVEEITTVAKTVFMPQPKVDSQVIRLDLIHPEEVPYESDIFKIARGAFTQRRKTIANSLTVGSGLSKKKVKERLDHLGLDPGLRAGDLDPSDYKRIAEDFYKL